ncbi:MAG: ATP-binding cassette domain-containing protein [Rhodospirillales bacterium]|nr:ATP-binding cassette domain-containing protein [Rhodospirillales bacterium]
MAGANFSLEWGEVHALLGENGAGKSTLMNVLAGFYTADAGILEVDGEAARFETPSAAADAGIGMVHQHFKLVGPLSVLENLRLACARRAGWRSKAEALRAMETLGKELGFRLDPSARVDEMAVSDQQKLEIMKVLLAGARILVLDEPTAVLTEQEAQSALGLARSLARSGRAVVLITHKLRDVLGFSDRVTVMRAGRTIIDGAASEGMTAASLSEAMVGGAPVTELPPPSGSRHFKPEMLRVKALCAPASAHGVALAKIDFSVQGGEIFGIAGIGGNGQAELVEALIGVRALTSGAVLFDGVDMPPSPEARRERGLRYIPADRMGMGLFGELPLNVNISLPRLLGGGAEKKWLVTKSWMNGLARDAISQFEVAGAQVDLPARLLSGGNAQKLMLAREFTGGMEILIAHSPTRGLDIRAVQAVQARLRAAAASGCAVLLISEDLDEIMQLSDRVAVMSHGRMSPAENVAAVDRARIGRLMLEMH